MSFELSSLMGLEFASILGTKFDQEETIERIIPPLEGYVVIMVAGKQSPIVKIEITNQEYNVLPENTESDILVPHEIVRKITGSTTAYYITSADCALDLKEYSYKGFSSLEDFYEAKKVDEDFYEELKKNLLIRNGKTKKMKI